MSQTRTRSLSPPSELLIACPMHGKRELSSCLSCKIRHSAICGALNDEELLDLEQIAGQRIIEAGQSLIIEGDPVTVAYNVVEGAVKLYKSLPDGRNQITGFLLPGDLLGLPSRGSYGYSAEALERTTLCVFPRPKLAALCTKYPHLEDRFLAVVNDEITASQEHVLLLGRKTAIERLATFLVLLLRRYERMGRPVQRLNLPMLRSDIADYLGLTIETVSRSFTRLKSEGLIDLPRTTEVTVRDRLRLEEIAGGL